MRQSGTPVVWNTNHGAPSSLSGERVLPLTALPEGMVSAAGNVDLDERGIVIPRKGITAFSTTGSPVTTSIQYLFGYRNGATDQLLAVGGSAMAMWTGSTWNAISNVDASSYGRDVMAVHYNGKVFLAYDSSVNRLHLYDGSVIRRVGVGAVAAPSVANTGAGAYAAVVRYYKVQMGILSGTTIITQSELSSATTFTPSGAGTAARITKPTTIDSATHWRVFASADNLTFYELDDWIVVGTTTKDDGYTVDLYPTNPDVAPEVGLYVPPPSARFLVTDGTRILMAGSHETTAAAGETTPSTKRVWFTRPIGVTDKGDDEAITQTAEFRYYIDVDDPNHTTITGLAAIGGAVYVFFDRATWRLVPTGIAGTPYRSEQVSGTVGALSQQAICVGGSPDNGDDAVYFVSQTSGLYRVSPGRGMEWLGRDVVPRTLPATLTNVTLAFDPVLRDLWVFASYGGQVVAPRAINIQLLRMRGAEPHGGARVMTFTASSGAAHTTAAFYGATLVFGGENNFSAAVLNSYTGADDNGTAIQASVRGRVIADFEHRFGAEEPIIQTNGASGSVTVGYADRLSSTVDVRTVGITVPLVTDGYIGRVFGLVLADGVSVQPSITMTGQTIVIESLTMPITSREAL